jgi:hypothetical protein
MLYGVAREVYLSCLGSLREECRDNAELLAECASTLRDGLPSNISAVKNLTKYSPNKLIPPKLVVRRLSRDHYSSKISRLDTRLIKFREHAAALIDCLEIVLGPDIAAYWENQIRVATSQVARNFEMGIADFRIPIISTKNKQRYIKLCTGRLEFFARFSNGTYTVIAFKGRSWEMLQ